VTNGGDEDDIEVRSTVAAPAGATFTVASYFHQVETCAASCASAGAQWTPVAGFGRARSRYTPALAPALAPGLPLPGRPVAPSPSGAGDGVLNARMLPGGIGRWSSEAPLSLPSDDEKRFCDSSQVQAMRYTIHYELTGSTAAAPVSAGTQSTVFNDSFFHDAN